MHKLKFLKLSLLSFISLIPSLAFCQCVGSHSFSNCWDNYGNQYNVMRSGNMTHVNGTNAHGENWDADYMRSGNMVFVNGHDKHGNSYSETCMIISGQLMCN